MKLYFLWVTLFVIKIFTFTCVAVGIYFAKKKQRLKSGFQSYRIFFSRKLACRIFFSQSYTCQLFLSQIREIFISILPKFPKIFSTTSKHYQRRFRQLLNITKDSRRGFNEFQRMPSVAVQSSKSQHDLVIKDSNVTLGTILWTIFGGNWI